MKQMTITKDDMNETSSHVGQNQGMIMDENLKHCVKCGKVRKQREFGINVFFFNTEYSWSNFLPFHSFV